jgi:hypothetical protein
MRLRWLAFLALGCSAQPVPNPKPLGLDSPVYVRSDWGNWLDADKDCQDTRQEVLVAESTVPITFVDDRHCRVATGSWTCPYTGQIFVDPSLLDIDHMVPLKVAFDGGGSAWSTDTKRAFFNDLGSPEALKAVSASANRSKGDRTPKEWMPQVGRCQYLKDWVTSKRRWQLPLESNDLLTLFIQECK